MTTQDTSTTQPGPPVTSAASAPSAAASSAAPDPALASTDEHPAVVDVTDAYQEAPVLLDPEEHAHAHDPDEEHDDEDEPLAPGDVFTSWNSVDYAVVCDVSRLDVLWLAVDPNRAPSTEPDGSDIVGLQKSSHEDFLEVHDRLDAASPEYTRATSAALLSLSVLVRGGTFV